MFDDTCNPSTGCKSTLNDSLWKKCTIDKCTLNGCTHTDVVCPPQKVLLGLICRDDYCDTSNGNCVPDLSHISLLCL